MARRVWRGLLLGGFLAGWTVPAIAAEAERPEGKSASPAPKEEVVREPDRLKVRKKTRVDFNDSTVDGQLIRPDGTYIPGTKRAQFDSLIQMRSHFYEELEKSSQDL